MGEEEKQGRRHRRKSSHTLRGALMGVHLPLMLSAMQWDGSAALPQVIGLCAGFGEGGGKVLPVLCACCKVGSSLSQACTPQTQNPPIVAQGYTSSPAASTSRLIPEEQAQRSSLDGGGL